MKNETRKEDRKKTMDRKQIRQIKMATREIRRDA